MDLLDGVRVGAFDEESDALRVLYVLYEGILFLPQDVFVHGTGPAEDVGREVVGRILGSTTTDELKTLHVPPLRTSQGQDPVFRKDVQTQGVNTLLVDDHKILLFLRAVDSLVANKIFQLDDFLAFGISEFPFRLDELFPLFRGGVEETGVDFSAWGRNACEVERWFLDTENGANVFSYSKLTLRVKM